MWYVVLINVIKIGVCVVLCFGILFGVCMLMYVVKFYCVFFTTNIRIQTPIAKYNTTHPPILITLISTTYHIGNYVTFCITIFAGHHML